MQTLIKDLLIAILIVGLTVAWAATTQTTTVL